MAYGKILQQGLKTAKKFGSKYKDELMLGGGLGVGSGILLDQLMWDPINKKKYYGEKNIEAIGQELKDWEQRPWDHEKDPNYVNETMKKLHIAITDDLDTMLVPRSVAKEKATDYVLAFLQMAQKKEGAPKMLSVRDEKVVYGAVGAEPPNPYTQDLPQGDTMMPEDFAPMKEPDEFMGVPTEGLKRY